MSSVLLHGTWIPDTSGDFIQSGHFYIWVEQALAQPVEDPTMHPHHLQGANLHAWLQKEMGIKDPVHPRENIATRYFWLPTHQHKPLLSWELGAYLQDEIPTNVELACWPVQCYKLSTVVNVHRHQHFEFANSSIAWLNELHFLSLCTPENIKLGRDLLFWYRYTQTLRQIIFKDQYIPTLKYRALTSPPTKTRKKNTKRETLSAEIYPSWEIISKDYEQCVDTFARAMPQVCCMGHLEATKTPHTYQPESLLRHFSECLLHDILGHIPKPQAFKKIVDNTLISYCLDYERLHTPVPAGENTLALYHAWHAWYQKILSAHQDTPFTLYLNLLEPKQKKAPWILEFWVAPQHDPSLKIALHEYWQSNAAKQTTLKKWLGQDFEARLLLQLGYAARMYPLLWQGMETDQPQSLALNVDQAHAFLRQDAWVLENAGFKVIIPAWWSAAGQRRAKLRLRGGLHQSKTPGSASKAKTLSLETLIDYNYQLVIGDEEVTAEEWGALVKAKQSLVQFRGQWVELDIDKMQEMLKFWNKQAKQNQPLALLEWMHQEATRDTYLEVERDQSLEQLLAQITDPIKFQAIDVLPGLQGNLREYQKRGVSWMALLERLGLNGCLADDMGLGKTLQVIARLLHERADGQRVAPTLLIAPTSVLGNWKKEVERFAPSLKVHIHHGLERDKNVKNATEWMADLDMLITSYSLVRLDSALLQAINWRRIVVDEAQNIKNPQAAQTKAILSLQAEYRLALTGTPVENRLLDLWSIFNFLNPGYLGKQAQFRKQFETRIQKDHNQHQALVLKRLVEPFILRRLKTDKTIIADLPEKIEQKVYCNLTKEQASLYEAIVKDIEKNLKKADGIKRSGLMLSALTRLKQICNHPRQFLQDESEFSTQRSHKLSRLQDMSEEIISQGESMLIFTQFQEIGQALEAHLRHQCRFETYFIHGATTRKKREQMIEQFQHPTSPPAAFILSLKAGGVGITLTRANHVFHFDRWWNPAVENQATDRAFRIGQQRNVLVHKFVTLGTVEERIDAMLEDKKRLAESIVEADESWLTKFDNESFKALIALNRETVLD